MNDTAEADTPLRIVAASPTKDGDLIVEDANGDVRLFIGSAGSLSRGRLNAEFLDALFRRQVWEQIDDDRRYTLADLQRRFSVPEGRGRGERTLAGAFGGRLPRRPISANPTPARRPRHMLDTFRTGW